MDIDQMVSLKHDCSTRRLYVKSEKKHASLKTCLGNTCLVKKHASREAFSFSFLNKLYINHI